MAIAVFDPEELDHDQADGVSGAGSADAPGAPPLHAARSLAIGGGMLGCAALAIVVASVAWMKQAQNARLENASALARAPHQPTAGRGAALFANTCSVCHGPAGQGVPHQGVDLRGSAFVLGVGDDELLAFLKRGRLPEDPKSVLKLPMPPRGGNAGLDDSDLADIVVYLRQLQTTVRAEQLRPANVAVASQNIN